MAARLILLGLAYWSQQLEQVNGNFDVIVDAFASSAEATARFGNATLEQRITQIYQDLFDRAPETDGLNYWMGEIQNGNHSIADMAIAVMQGASGGDQQLNTLRQKAAEEFTSQVQSQGLNYEGNTAAEAARLLIQSVTSTTSDADLLALAQANAQLANLASTSPAVIQALVGKGSLVDLLETTTGTAAPLSLLNMVLSVASAAKGNAGTLDGLLKGGTLADLIHALPKGSTLDDVTKAITDGGLEGGIDVMYPPTTSGGSTPTAPSFTVTNNNEGTLAFAGTATGDITFTVASDGVATFVRGGVTASTTIVVSAITSAGGSTIKLSANATGLSVANADAMTSITDFSANGKTYSVEDTAAAILGAAPATIAGAAAVTVTGGDAGTLSVADHCTLKGLTTVDSWSYSVEDTAAAILGAAPATITSAAAVTVSGGAAGTLTAAEVVILKGLTTDDSWIYSITGINGSADDIVAALAALGEVPTDFNSTLEAGIDLARDISAIALAHGTGTIDGSKLTGIDGSADDIVAALTALGEVPTDFNSTLEAGIDLARDISAIALAHGTGTIDGSKLTGIDGSADDIVAALAALGEVPTDFNSTLVGASSIAQLAYISSVNGDGELTYGAISDTIEQANTMNFTTTNWIATTGVTLSGSDGSQIVTGSQYADSITGGAGADNLTGNAGNDVFTYTGTTAATLSAETGVTTATADVIADFTTAADTIDLAVVGAVANFYELDADSTGGDDITTVELAVAAANAAVGAGTSFDGTVQYIYVIDGTGGASNGYLVADEDLDGTADYAITLTGLFATGGLVATDIV